MEENLKPNLIAQQWEGSLIQTIQNPQTGIANALILAGNDRRCGVCRF
jgi:hypothetical protein